EPVPGIANEYRLTQRFLPGITLEEINGLARAWIVDRNRVVLVNAPDKPGLTTPTKEQLLAVIDGVGKKSIQAYQDLATNAPLVPRVPAGAPVVEEKAIPAIAVREWRLANGVRVVLKPTDFKNDEILVSAWSPGGTSLAPDSLYIPASTASAVVTQNGVGDFTLIDLQKALAGKEAGVRPVIGTLGEGVSGSASPKDVETLFQLIYLYFTAPRRDTAAFQALREQLEAL